MGNIFRRHLDWARLAYYRTSPKLRFIFLPFITILNYARNLKLDLWVIKGKEIKSSHELSIFFAGNAESKHYFIKSVFGDFYDEQYIGRAWLWRISHVVKKRRINPSLMITEVHHPLSVFYNKQKYFYVPGWVSLESDISIAMSKLMKSRSLKSDLSRIRKSKLDFELTNELDRFSDFYYNMYLPYTNKAHDNRAVIHQYEDMKSEFKNCDLLLLKKEQEYIAGILINYVKNKARLWSSGIKNGNLKYVTKDRAKGALYYFSILCLREKGFQTLEFGYSRAFLNDGALQYKKKWNPNISITPYRGFLIKPANKTDGVRSFLLNNPFIFYKKKKLNGAVFIESQESISIKQFKKIYKNYFLSGMHRLYIYRFRDSDSGETKSIVPSELRDKVKFQSLENFF